MTNTDFAKRRKVVLTTIYSGIVILGAAVFVLFDQTIIARSIDEQRAGYKRTLEALTFRMDQKLQAYSSMSYSLAAALSFDSVNNTVEFHKLAELMRRENASVINIGRAKDYVVQDVHPLDENQGVLGFDYRTAPSQLPGVEKALTTGETIIDGPVQLVQGNLGLLLRTAQQGDENVVYTVVLDLETFFQETGLASDTEELITSVRDVHANGQDSIVIFGEDTVWSTDPVIHRDVLGSKTVEFGLAPVNGWKVDKSYRLVLALVLLGLGALAAHGVNYARVLIKDRAEAKRRLIDAIESINDGFVIYDENDRLLMCNRKYREMYGFVEGGIQIGDKFEDIIRKGVAMGHYPSAEGREENWISERLALHADTERQTEIPLWDGRWILAADTRTNDGCTVGIRIDVTELKKALEEANAAIQAKTDFINNMSHELRTPLSIVLGNIALLRKIEMFPQFKSLNAEICGNEPASGLLQDLVRLVDAQATKSEKSGKHLLDLINTILEWSKLSIGNVALNVEKINVGKLIEGVCEELQGMAGQKGIELESNTINVAISADPLMLRQIFINLVNNAIKFTEVGNVRVSMEKTENSVRATVSDTGIGIPAAQHASVFERFNQVDTSSSREHGGIGLGLAIVKKLVDLHGGEILVESTPGVGSAFCVVLPVGETTRSKEPVNLRGATTVEVAAGTRSGRVVTSGGKPVERRIIDGGGKHDGS